MSSRSLASQWSGGVSFSRGRAVGVPPTTNTYKATIQPLQRLIQGGFFPLVLLTTSYLSLGRVDASGYQEEKKHIAVKPYCLRQQLFHHC